jgi:hypothetical protein
VALDSALSLFSDNQELVKPVAYSIQNISLVQSIIHDLHYCAVQQYEKIGNYQFFLDKAVCFLLKIGQINLPRLKNLI